jgi:hypothetical protein
MPADFPQGRGRAPAEAAGVFIEEPQQPGDDLLHLRGMAVGHVAQALQGPPVQGS